MTSRAAPANTSRGCSHGLLASVFSGCICAAKLKVVEIVTQVAVYETHFVIKCPCTDLARSTMISEISAQYPEFRSHYDTASDLGKVKLVLWQIPDGEFPGAPSPGIAPESARITSTRAILRYLRTATENHPRLRLYNRPRS